MGHLKLPAFDVVNMDRGSSFKVQANENPSLASSSLNLISEKLRSPSDEVLLTELALDTHDITIYDLNSIISLGGSVTAAFAHFKCFMDHQTKEFFIEVNADTPLRVFTKSTLLRMLELAESEKAKWVYVCISNDIDEMSAFKKTFSFVGFAPRGSDRHHSLLKTETHSVLQCCLEEEEEEL